MKRTLAATLLLALVATAFFAGAQPGSAKLAPRAPADFFGIAPQNQLTDADAEYMKAGGIDVVRWPLLWAEVQPSANAPFNWKGFDEVVSVAARHGLRVLPFFYGSPGWIAKKPTTLPINSSRVKQAWAKFLEAAVERYGPGGDFWKEHSPAKVTGGVAVSYEPAVPAVVPIPTPLPIRTWQVWNEANFFYFAYPASPQRYAKLVMVSGPALKRADPGARVVLTGLFGEPTARGPKGMPADKFLEILYRTPGIKSRFDGVALHPYAVDAETLEELVEGLHEVTLENRDRVPLYITEMGWGSENNFQNVAFEQGKQGQVKQLRDSYTYLLENRNRLSLKQVYWFSWKDQRDSCDFCDSVGFFRQGLRFHAKPAWRAFIEIARGRTRP
jgi:hypothetical protein